MSSQMQPGPSNGRVGQTSAGNSPNSARTGSTITAAPGTGNSVPNSMPPGEVREYLFKLLIIGELGTGKTSFIKRYVHQFFSTHYRATVSLLFPLLPVT